MRIYHDAELSWRELYIKSTGVRVPLDAGLVRAIYRQVMFYFLVSATFWARVITFRRQPYTIGFVPEQPKPWYQIWNITKFMGLTYCDDWAACDVLFYFEDRTEIEVDEALLGQPGKKMLNGNCRNIGKGHVEAVFEKTFGYALGVDPTRFEGKVVQKSNENASHDGRIIECPIAAPEPGYSYQRFVENCYDGEMAEDIRVPMVGGKIPFVYLKRRPLGIRFTNENTECVMIETEEALSQSEVALLVDFAHNMGLDFGGLDVLRDRDTGRIYVVDVNKTDMGPPVPLATWKKMVACARLGRAFVGMIKLNKADNAKDLATERAA